MNLVFAEAGKSISDAVVENSIRHKRFCLSLFLWTGFLLEAYDSSIADHAMTFFTVGDIIKNNTIVFGIRN